MIETKLPHDESRSHLLIIPPAILFSIAFTLCLAKFYTRFRQRGMGVDDALLFIGLIPASGLLVASIIAAKHGMGRHVFYLTQPEISMTALMGLLIEEFYVYSGMFVKLSLAWMLLRIIGDNKVLRRGIYALMGLITLTAITSVAWHYRQCRPLKALWQFRYPRSVCIPRETFRIWMYTASAIFFVTDLIIAILPVFVIRKVQLPRYQKVLVVLLMGLGFLCTAAIVPKLLSLKGFMTAQDITWLAADLIMWSTIEIYIGIMAAAIPSLKKPLEEKLNAWGWIDTLSPASSRSRSIVLSESSEKDGGGFWRRSNQLQLHHIEMDERESTGKDSSSVATREQLNANSV